MDLEQRYTEENNYFQFDDYFFEALKDFSSEEIKSIIKQCTSVVDQLPLDNSFPQYVAGVTTGKTPKFFIVEYFKEQGDEYDNQTYFIELKEIECDEYLDHINKKLSIKSYYENKIQSGTDIKENTTGSIGVVENMWKTFSMQSIREK